MTENSPDYPPLPPGGDPWPRSSGPPRPAPDYPPLPPDYPPPPPSDYGLGQTGLGQTQGGWGYPPPAHGGTNRMAIASLVCSLLGWMFCGVGPFLGVIFGFMALRRIKQSGERGRGLALAGLIIGALMILFELVAVQNGTVSHLVSSA